MTIIPLDKITKVKIDIFDGVFVVVDFFFHKGFIIINFVPLNLSTLRMFRSLALQTLDEMKIKRKKTKNYFVSFEKFD